MRLVSHSTRHPISKKPVELTAKSHPQQPKITLPIAKITLILAGISLLLALLSVAGHALQYVSDTDHYVEFTRLFNLGGERNIPTWFSSILAFLCALLLWANGWLAQKNQQPFRRHWQVLAGIFLFISLSTVATIHDWTLEIPLVEAWQLGGWFTFPWVIFGWLAVAIMALTYAGFVRHLPPITRRGVIIAGISYLTGALILEMLSAYLFDLHTQQTLLRGIVATIEEMLEMAGLILFLHSLMGHLTSFKVVFD